MLQENLALLQLDSQVVEIEDRISKIKRQIKQASTSQYYEHGNRKEYKEQQADDNISLDIKRIESEAANLRNAGRILKIFQYNTIESITILIRPTKFQTICGNKSNALSYVEHQGKKIDNYGSDGGGKYRILEGEITLYRSEATSEGDWEATSTTLSKSEIFVAGRDKAIATGIPLTVIESLVSTTSTSASTIPSLGEKTAEFQQQESLTSLLTEEEKVELKRRVQLLRRDVGNGILGDVENQKLWQLAKMMTCQTYSTGVTFVKNGSYGRFFVLHSGFATGLKDVTYVNINSHAPLTNQGSISRMTLTRSESRRNSLTTSKPPESKLKKDLVEIHRFEPGACFGALNADPKEGVCQFSVISDTQVKVMSCTLKELELYLEAKHIKRLQVYIGALDIDVMQAIKEKEERDQWEITKRSVVENIKREIGLKKLRRDLIPKEMFSLQQSFRAGISLINSREKGIRIKGPTKKEYIDSVIEKAEG
eukprot:jgi/Bigna1/81148/fgenesh1_pg.77_\